MVLTLFHPLYNVNETVHFKEDLFSEFFVDALLCLNVEIYIFVTTGFPFGMFVFVLL